uniref:lamin tail domain-containing protein 1-like n=1 Tax=Pristiophorus japonicus TaxID=55135 RepID=UPI00398F33A6
MFACDESHVPKKSRDSCLGREAVGSTYTDISSSTAMELLNGDEPQGFCSKPPTHSLNSCKFGQGKDYFNTMFKELKRNSAINVLPICKPLGTACDLNTPTASSLGNIKIVEVAANGHFVRLSNVSVDTEEDIGNHILQQNIGGHPVTVYTFPPRTRVNAGSVVTVWAAGAKVPHNPPKDFLWKECNKFGTGAECITILCKPNGQAIAWFTPAPGNSKLKDPCKDGKQFTTCDHQVSTNDCRVNLQLDKEKDQTTSNMCYFSPSVLSIKQKPHFVHPSVRCPWGQSTAMTTHPDFSMLRTLSLGNDGSSLSRDSRSQSSRPDPIPDNLRSGSTASSQCRRNSSNKNDKQSATHSTANSSGQLKGFAPRTLPSQVQQSCTDLQHLQSMQNLAFQPPLPRPPPVASW